MRRRMGPARTGGFGPARTVGGFGPARTVGGFGPARTVGGFACPGGEICADCGSWIGGARCGRIVRVVRRQGCPPYIGEAVKA